VDGSGTVAFIADTHNHRIVQMRLSDGAQVGTAISGVGDFLNGGTALRFPRGVTWAIMQNPNTWWKQDMIRVLFVADTGNNRILCLHVNGVDTYKNAAPNAVMSFSLKWYKGSVGSDAAQYQLKHPMAIAVHGESVWIVDSGNDRIVQYNHRGLYLRSLGTKGTAPGQFMQPWGLAIVGLGDGARLIVSEWQGKRVQVLALSGAPVQTIAAPGGGRLGGVALFRRDDLDRSADRWRIAVTDRSNSRFYLLKR